MDTTRVLITPTPFANRAASSRRLRHAFRELAIELEAIKYVPEDRAIIREALKGFHVHHILPRSLGGVDILENLVLIEPNLHSTVHTLISERAKDALKEDPERPVISLPIPRGKVWGFERESVHHLWQLTVKKQQRLREVML
jgi:hypothetical protein